MGHALLALVCCLFSSALACMVAYFGSAASNAAAASGGGGGGGGGGAGVKYSGCKYEGQFSAVNGKKPKAWVAATNIVAVHSKDFARYKLKTLRLRNPATGKTLDAVVYDECADKDCGGCCSKNARQVPDNFLIDLEVNTARRFYGGSVKDTAVIEWAPVG